jgi:hypothetical protein
VVAVLRSIAAGRHASVKPIQPLLSPVPAGIVEPAIALRRIVRLASLGDVRPAREALVAAGIDAEPLDGLPAIVTVPIDKPAALGIEALTAAYHVTPASVIPLWEDIAIPVPASREYVTTTSSAISTPA